MESLTVLLCVLLSVACCVVAYYKLFTRGGNKSNALMRRHRPPGPAGIPLLGNVFDLGGGELHHVFATLAAAHGPVVSLKLGTSRILVVSSAAGARDVLQRHDAVLAGRSVADAARVLSNHEHSLLWLPASSALFKRLRAVCSNHLFSARGLGATRPIRERKVRELVACLRGAGEAVDVGGVVLAGMLNLMSSVLFSEDVADLASAGQQAQELETLINGTIGEITKPNLSDLFPVLAPLDLQGRRRSNAEYTRKLFDFLDRVISHRKSAGGERKDDFLDVLLQLHSEDQISAQTVKSFLLDLFVAGTATTSLTVQWAMAELLRHPAVMSKVRDELRQVVGSSKQLPDEDDVDRLPYLRVVVMETMRLHPPSPLTMPHVAMGDGAEVGGFAVAKGTKVIVNIWTIMRDPASWEKPEEFVPERFLGTDVDFRGMDARAFVPFGAGRRVCPGYPMATRSVMLILASLLHALEWTLPEGMQPCDVDIREKFGTSLNMLTPLKAIPNAYISW